MIPISAPPGSSHAGNTPFRSGSSHIGKSSHWTRFLDQRYHVERKFYQDHKEGERMMRTIKWFLACMFVIAGGNALAIDAYDEDASYLPQTILDQIAAKDHKYGYDRTFFMNCVSEGRKKTKDQVELNRMEKACRINATPRKCREVSPLPPRGKSESPQEICAAACKSAGKVAGGDKGCA